MVSSHPREVTDSSVVKPKQQLQSFAFAKPSTAEQRDVVFVVKDGTIGVGPIGRSAAVS